MTAARIGSDDRCEPASAGVPAPWLRNGVRVLAASAVVGLLLTALDPRLAALVDNVVYSTCIGLCVYAVYVAIRLLVAPKRANASARDLVLRGAVAVPVGLFVGLNVAALLLGHPTGFGRLARTAFVAVPVTVVASACFMYYFWSKKRFADAAAAHADGQRLMAEARLGLLQAQIEPHMLFNTLANLRTLVDVDPARAQTMIDQLIVYLRATLAASRNTTTTLAHEFDQLAAYLALMQVRMGPRLAFVLDLPDDLRERSVPPMLLQPLVENAIKHGLEPKIEGGTIRVLAAEADGVLRLEVRDDGIGLADEPGEPGYGLVHVRERLRTLHGNAASLAMDALPAGGVSALVTLPR